MPVGHLRVGFVVLIVFRGVMESLAFLQVMVRLQEMIRDMERKFTLN